VLDPVPATFSFQDTGLCVDTFVHERKHRLFKSVAKSQYNLNVFEKNLVHQLCSVQVSELASHPFPLQPIFVGAEHSGDHLQGALQANNIKLHVAVRLPKLTVHVDDVVLLGCLAGKVIACVKADGEALILIEKFTTARRSLLGIDRWTRLNEFVFFSVRDHRFTLASYWMQESDDVLLTLN